MTYIHLGFTVHEVRQIERLVVKHRVTLMEAWDEYFGA